MLLSAIRYRESQKMDQKKRNDEGLAFLLRYENIAWYENGIVRVFDRRTYPAEEKFVECRTHQEAAKAISDMVTQSGGPFLLCGMAMALAADEANGRSASEKITYLKQAAETLCTARPTTRKKMEMIASRCIETAKTAISGGLDPGREIFNDTLKRIDAKYARYGVIARNLVDLFPESGNIMTQCFGETIVGCMLREINNRHYDIKVFVPETRPWFQGARLTASVCADMGFDTTLITDNMPAFVMEHEGINVFTSAADVICMDGSVCNKTGTFHIALAARYHGIPYYVTGRPDAGHPDAGSVNIEMRDPEFVLQAAGVQIAKRGVKGYYPAFDITPPHLVSGIVTDRGTFVPGGIRRYFD